MDRTELRLAAAQRMAIAAKVSAQFEGPSRLDRLAKLPGVREWVSALRPIDAARLYYAWEMRARPKQLLPKTPWETCIVCAGRGFGKNRCAAEHVRSQVFGGKWTSTLFIGPTEKETMRYMVGGRRKEKGSGFLDVLSPWERNRVTLLEGKRELRISTEFGDATIYLCSGEDRELRGAGLDSCWFDEPIKVNRVSELLDNIMLALREGENAQLLVTTTPKANANWLRELLVDPGTIVRRGSTTENSALTKAAVARMQRRFAGTRLAAQELEGELLSDEPGTLFKQSVIDQHRVSYTPPLEEICLGLDPSKSGHADSDECGIVAVGRARGHYYILADGTQRSDPLVWVASLKELWERHKATTIVVETNNVGRLASSTIRASWARDGVPPHIKEIHADTDKLTRAEPLSVFYERGLIHHVGTLAKLEDELTGFAPGGKSPNGLDAVGHAVHHLSNGYMR